MRNVWLGVGLVVLWALVGWAQTYGPGEIQYGGVTLRFSGRLTTAGTCSPATQPGPGVTQIHCHCQIPEGVAGTIELTATRTPAGAVNIRADSVPAGWPSSLWTRKPDEAWVDSRLPAASGWGTIVAQYRFTPPAGSAGRRVELKFKAWTMGVIGELELKVILDIVKPAPPPPGPKESVPSYGPFPGATDAWGRLSVSIPMLLNTSVTGELTECTVKPLPNTPVSVTLVPKPGATIRGVGDIGSVRVASPGYIETEIVQLALLSSMDMWGRIYTTVDVGTVCLRPAAPVTPPPVTPTGPISGKSDGEGKFTVPLPFPRATASGRLLDPQGRPLANRTFTLVPIPKGATLVSPEDIGGFMVFVPGHVRITVAKFSMFSLFGLTSFLLGDVQLSEAELPWSANRPLTWDDFQGNPPEGAEDGAEAAKIVMGLGYSFQTRTWFDKATGKWKAHLTSVTTTNTMDRSQSWVVPGKKTPELLNHEQKHFDLNEVYRRLLDAALQKLVCILEATGDTEKEAEENLDKKLKETFDKVNKKCDEVQDQYDKETDHGRNAEKQKEWDKKIGDWLADPNKAPQP